MDGFFRKMTSRIKGRFQYSVFPWLVDSLTSAAMTKAAKNLKKENIGRILIDNTLLAHGVTHKTAWIDTGKAEWGDVEIETGYAARIPVHSEQDNSEAARSVRYLPGIANLAKRGHIILAMSQELRDEQWTQPSGRFVGYGVYDFSIFQGLEIETIDDPEYSMVIAPNLSVPSLKEQRRKRLASKTDPLYHDLIKVLGWNNSQDIWHIVTAERNDCYCFLTMDFGLIGNVRAQEKNKVIQSLRTKIITPEEFGMEFSIVPLSPRLLSFHGASFPVAAKTNWENSKRQKRRSK